MWKLMSLHSINLDVVGLDEVESRFKGNRTLPHCYSDQVSSLKSRQCVGFNKDDFQQLFDVFRVHDTAQISKPNCSLAINVSY